MAPKPDTSLGALATARPVSPWLPEWGNNALTWVGFPSHADLWEEDLIPAQAEVADLVRALATRGRGGPEGLGPQRTTDRRATEAVRVLAADRLAGAAARSLLVDLVAAGRVHVQVAPFGDIWLRDTVPLFAAQSGRLVAHAPRFNGWGGKYSLPGDDTVGAYVAGASGADLVAHEAVLEGGAIDWDGVGTVLTTRECLLNPNRNPGWQTEADAEAFLLGSLGFKKVIWITEGLLNDHTDGHVDNIARFVGPAQVAVQVASGPDDPHAGRLAAIRAELRGQTDAAGRRLRLVEVPSPGRILDADGEVMPASHMNFVLGKGVVVVPTYDPKYGVEAAQALSNVFRGRTVIGSPSTAILSGGGSFHCISKQVPRLPRLTKG
jgi:agmatine deiminase